MTDFIFKITRLKPVFVLILFSLSLPGQVRLPRLVSDGMVLQRDADVKIWGWAAPGEELAIQFIDSTYFTQANVSGEWGINLKYLKPGGPYTMQIKASNEIVIADIMIGDVWVCSGQSNMELPVRRISWVYPAEIADCENTFIRQFQVPQSYDFNVQHEDLNSGSWKTVNRESILDFSAVAYFFAKELYEKYKIPIGLINSSLGGSPAAAWMSEDALKQFPDQYNEMQRFKDTSLINQIIQSDSLRIQTWYNQLNQKDAGYKDKNNVWFQPSLNMCDWKTIQVPSFWAGTELEETNGAVWYRRTFNIPATIAKKPAKLILGCIVDADSVFINGVFAGTTSYKYPPRRYNIPSGLLKEGENTIVIRVISNQGVGGFVPDKPYEIICGADTLNLTGTWQYRLGAVMEPLASRTSIRWKPGGLYNAMLAPLLNYRIKGVIWYQGESNAERPLEYRELFPALIQNWRNDWNQGEFPFIFVQLTNFMESNNQPTESNWALLRESQLKTLSLPGTGMAVTVDIGEWNDIHPLNKKDVGYRLSVAAQKVAYGDTGVVYSGPIYESMKNEGNKIILSFTNTGRGLIANGGDELRQFAIAGSDKQFVWAHAKVENDKVIVWSDKISNPVAARYAWADNPEGANLFNREGLPASPFRTDDWILKNE